MLIGRLTLGVCRDLLGKICKGSYAFRAVLEHLLGRFCKTECRNFGITANVVGGFNLEETRYLELSQEIKELSQGTYS